ALPWFQKAATKNHGQAQLYIGWMYSEEFGVPKNHQIALEWLQKAAENGNASASYNIGHMYGEGLGVSKDYNIAMKWFLKAYKQGNHSAANNIGFMYRNGLGVPKNSHTAVEWYIKAANQGEKIALYNLGRIYENEDEIRDIYKAIEWYKKASDKNDQKSKEALERLNKKNHCIPRRELGLALKSYKEAAVNGHIDACIIISLFYKEAKGILRDYKKPMECFLKAAHQENVYNLFELARTH
ncbi:HCP-like protein, partial [Backusella circina FSU 941]